jgi:butyryl-CoA dehydrogenase
MDFELTKQEEFVRQMVRKFAENEVDPIAADIDKEHRFPSETVEKMAANGFMGIPIPTEYEGAGGDQLSYIIAIEEIAKKCLTTSTILAAHTSLCVAPIFNFGTDEQKKKYLPDLCSGRKLGAFGLTEPGAGTDAAGQQTKAHKEGNEWVINGSKCFITNGGYAETFVIAAMTDKSKGTRGISTFIVEKSDKGFSIGKTEDKMGINGSSTTELLFEDMRIPEDRLLGEEGRGFNVAMETLDGARVGIGAQALGLAEGALEVTIEYLNQRKQFGKKLSKFQVNAFKIADMATRCQASKMLVYYAAWCEQSGKSYIVPSSMAKVYASETAMYVTHEAVQLYGGYGYIADYPVERMMRDAKITEIYEGTSEVQRMIISSNILNK